MGITQPESATTPTTHAAINGLRMHYRRVGTGAPALFIHPILSHGGLVPELTANRRWIIPDLHGHGRTALGGRAMSCVQFVDDLAALLDHLGIDACDVFGDSFGGTLAVLLALRHPQRVRRIATYGSPLIPLPAGLITALPADCPQLRTEREAYPLVAPEPTRWADLHAMVLTACSAWGGFSPADLGSLAVPVLLAGGDRDLIPVARLVELQSLIPGAQLAVIPDASHFVLFSEPAKLLPTIAAFLDAPPPTLPLSTFTSGFQPGTTR